VKGLAILIATASALLATSCTHCGDAAAHAGNYASVATTKSPAGKSHPVSYLQIRADGKVTTTDTPVPKSNDDYIPAGKLCPSREDAKHAELKTLSYRGLWFGRTFTFSKDLHTVTISKALLQDGSFLAGEIKFRRVANDR
jgi:hypothetical protein